MIERAEAAGGVLEITSDEYLGQWQRLVSTTNWEKGRIIAEWRQALQDAAADAAEFSDEAWSRRVGNVTGQHVGRLRRVFERFGANHSSYRGLYWSHFQAALDWNDAEMWLEGAVQNDWSVAAMRSQRWETLRPDEPPPAESDLVSAELDEDRGDSDDSIVQSLSSAVQRFDSPDGGDDFSHDERSSRSAAGVADETEIAPWDTTSGDEAVAVEPVRPFARLAELPDDLADAFEAFKLALLHHKLDGWRKISCADALASLDALKQLALAPTE